METEKQTGQGSGVLVGSLLSFAVAVHDDREGLAYIVRDVCLCYDHAPYVAEGHDLEPLQGLPV